MEVCRRVGAGARRDSRSHRADPGRRSPGTYAEFDDRAARLAAAFDAAGLGPDAKVASYLYNCNEYTEALLRDVQAPRRARSTSTTATSTTSSRTCSTTPTPRCWCSTVARRARGGPRPGAEGEALVQVDDGAPHQDFARALRRPARRARSDAAHRALGRRPLLPLHRRHHGHAQGRDVAQRGPRGACSPTARYVLVGRAAARRLERRRRDRRRASVDAGGPRSISRRRR